MSTKLIFSDISDTHKSLDVTVEGIWVEMMERTQHFTSCFPVGPNSLHSFLVGNIHVKFPIFKVEKPLVKKKEVLHCLLDCIEHNFKAAL